MEVTLKGALVTNANLPVISPSGSQSPMLPRKGYNADMIDNHMRKIILALRANSATRLTYGHLEAIW
jgi:hypothetical protein